jgi:hypothetical protein
MFLMWGYEGEQPEDIEATVAHVKACLPDVFLTTVSYPIKGTPYYDEVAPRLVGIGDWARSTDRDFKIAGRHSRRYYGFADQLLKSEVALARSGDGELRAQVEAAAGARRSVPGSGGMRLLCPACRPKPTWMPLALECGTGCV